jgi:hypothetical protein
VRVRAPAAADPAVGVFAEEVARERKQPMGRPAEPAEALQAWLTVPSEIEKALEGLPEDALDLRGGGEGWSIRETVHHLVEANLIASNIMIAALAGSTSPYDWSWVNPDASWMRRLGYQTAPIRPALATLRALCEHMAGLIGATTDGLRREVQLLDAPGAALYAKTVEDLLREQVGHARDHLRDVAQIRAAHGR